MAQGPVAMADTDTAGTVECEVRAGASDAEGCGMDASDDFAVFEEAAVLDLGVDGIVANGPGLAAAGGGVATRVRMPSPQANVPRMAQRSTAAAGRPRGR